jgi:hypothetical protein
MVDSTLAFSGHPGRGVEAAAPRHRPLAASAGSSLPRGSSLVFYCSTTVYRRTAPTRASTREEGTPLAWAPRFPREQRHGKGSPRCGQRPSQHPASLGHTRYSALPAAINDHAARNGSLAGGREVPSQA